MTHITQFPQLNSKPRNNQVYSSSDQNPYLNPMINTSQTIYKQFYKTRLCPYYLSNFCRRGSACTYAHSINELHVPPDLYKTKICPDWQTGFCNKSTCRFAHGWKELRATDYFYKTRICHFWLTGACNKGEACRHAHGFENMALLLNSSELGDREGLIFSSSDQWDASTASSKSLNDSSRPNLKIVHEYSGDKRYNKIPHLSSNGFFNSSPVENPCTVSKNYSVPKDLSLSMSSLNLAQNISQYFNTEYGKDESQNYPDENTLEYDAITKMIEVLKLDDITDNLLEEEACLNEPNLYNLNYNFVDNTMPYSTDHTHESLISNYHNNNLYNPSLPISPK